MQKALKNFAKKSSTIFLGSISALLLILVVLDANESFAAPVPYDICDGYLVKSQALGCDSSNYLTQYGYRYCRAFETRQASFSPEGQQTLTRLRRCLVNAIRTAPVTCESIGTFAMQSHYDCYIDSGFCEMNPLDQLHVLWMVRDQVATPEFIEVSSEVAGECARRGELKQPLDADSRVRTNLDAATTN